nr:MAG TPA: hypothetical protein [Caudoviricetes sp.]
MLRCKHKIHCCFLLALRLSVVVLSFDGLMISHYLHFARWNIAQKIYSLVVHDD